MASKQSAFKDIEGERITVLLTLDERVPITFGTDDDVDFVAGLKAGIITFLVGRVEDGTLIPLIHVELPSYTFTQ